MTDAFRRAQEAAKQEVHIKAQAESHLRACQALLGERQAALRNLEPPERNREDLGIEVSKLNGEITNLGTKVDLDGMTADLAGIKQKVAEAEVTDAQTLSPLIDTAAERFNSGLELEDDAKIDFKVKAKQFVKIYGQMASILPFEILEWEQLFWFLKFLLPKLQVKDPNEDTLDALLDAVDLSSYGLEWTCHALVPLQVLV